MGHEREAFSWIIEPNVSHMPTLYLFISAEASAKKRRRVRKENFLCVLSASLLALASALMKRCKHRVCEVFPTRSPSTL